MRRLCASAALLLVVSVIALLVHDTPVVTTVAKAAELGPAPVTAAPTPEPAPETPPTAAPATATTPAPAPVPVATPVSGAAKLSAAAPPASSPITLLPGVTLPPLPLPPLLTPAPAPPPSAPPAAAAAAGGIGPYLGLGTWVDAYDWSLLFSKNKPTVGVEHVDQMARAGVQTLYIQASKHDSPTDVLEPSLVQAIIDRARARGIKVVVWYLPTLVDTGADLRRIKAIARLRNVDGVAIDIEARNVADVNDRNRRLIDLSAAIRRELPGRTIGAIVLPPVVLEVINLKFWPSFPYREIAPFYDVWMTMGYWTNRTAASGYRDAYRYTKENVDRLRNNLGQPNAPVHPIGGIGDRTSAADVEQFKRAVSAVNGIGGSIYDWHTTAGGLWENLRAMRLR